MKKIIKINEKNFFIFIFNLLLKREKIKKKKLKYIYYFIDRYQVMSDDL